MSRKSRNSYPHGFFHVMVQGINKSKIFNLSTYKSIYLNLIKNYYSHYNVSIISYCIMDNHAHLLLYVDNIDDLSLFMHKLNSSYAHIYNVKENRVGYVFRDRFKSECIRDTKYLIYCIKYIHMNPVKAGFSKREAHYSFSSYNEYVKQAGIIDYSKIKEIFNSDDFNIILQILNELNASQNYISANIKADISSYLDNINSSLDNIKSDNIKLYDLINYLKDKNYKQYVIANQLGLPQYKVSRLLNKHSHK